MDRGHGAAVRLPERDRKDLAIQALTRSETISDLAARHGVSRKFISQQAHKARAALDDAFSSGAPDNEVRFELAVTKAWLRQVIVALPLICRSSYRGVVEFLRDLLGLPVSVGCVHDVLQAAPREACAVNHEQDLSGLRVGLHDEIFQGATPVLAGVDAASTSCYLLAAEQHRDADTWGVPLLDAAEQGLRPDPTMAEAGQGLRVGQKAAWGDTPCHGDVFPIQRPCEGLATTLTRLAQGAPSRRKMRLARTGRAGQRNPDNDLAAQLALARQAETQANQLARDIRTLVQWLSHDVLALAGPALATRRELFDFIVAALAARELEDARRIRPVRVALQNQRDDRLAFAGVLDDKLAAIARAHGLSEPLARDACLLHRLPTTSPAYWQGWNRLHAQMGGKFHALFDAVSRAMADTPRSSALVENLNSRLRTYFTLRRHLGGSYLDLLRFFLNHQPLRAQPPCRAPGQEPAGADGRPRPSALADLAGPGTASAPASLTRGGSPPPAQDTPLVEIRPSQAGCLRTPV